MTLYFCLRDMNVSLSGIPIVRNHSLFCSGEDFSGQTIFVYGQRRKLFGVTVKICSIPLSSVYESIISFRVSINPLSLRRF